MILPRTRQLKRGIFLFFILFLLPSSMVSGKNRYSLQTEEIVVIYSERLHKAAQEVLKLYPKLKTDLEEGLTWPFQGITNALLIDNRLEFQKIVGHKLIVAIAIPQANLIVIDFPRASAHPFSFGSILKHEMCHLLLHQHIQSSNLPKWLDEGICQWMSDGMAEIILEQNSSILDSAILANRLISMRRLNHTFPREDQALRLAYEQSKSLVAYINSRLGKTGIIHLLEQLKQGLDVDTSVYNSMGISFEELEGQWRESLERKTNWFSYFAKNLYVIVFFLAAVITIAAFIRLIIRKRKTMDEMD
jgi:hypothetical protein